jgi:ribosome-dependent ATPase
MSAGAFPDPVVRLRGVRLRYRKVEALAGIDQELPSACLVGLIGPDGVGKSSLLSLVAGARKPSRTAAWKCSAATCASAATATRCARASRTCRRAWASNLYPTLSVEENLQFFARLFGHDADERRRRIDDLTRSTGLHKFLARPAGKLSGGMKQKLGLCCALIHDPDLLDPGRADHRRRSAGTRAVLGPDRSHPRPAPGHERDRGHRLHGRGAAL